MRCQYLSYLHTKNCTPINCASWHSRIQRATNTMSAMTFKGHITKSTLTDPRKTPGRGQGRSSTAISKMMRRIAATCPKDSRITAPSLRDYSHNSDPWLLSAHGFRATWCTGVLWLNVLLVSNCGRIGWERFHMSCHEYRLGIEQ